MIGASSAVVRWLVTAQDPPIAILVAVQLMHGLTYGATLLGTMGLLIRNVPGHRGERPRLPRGLFGHRHQHCLDLSGAIYAQHGQGVYYVMAAMGARRPRDLAGAPPAGRSTRACGSAPERGVRWIDGAAVVAQAGIAIPASNSGPSRSTKRACCAMSIAGAIDSDVATMQPTMISKPRACAASAIARASVRPPVLSSLMLMAS